MFLPPWCDAATRSRGKPPQPPFPLIAERVERGRLHANTCSRLGRKNFMARQSEFLFRSHRRAAPPPFQMGRCVTRTRIPATGQLRPAPPWTPSPDSNIFCGKVPTSCAVLGMIAASELARKRWLVYFPHIAPSRRLARRPIADLGRQRRPDAAFAADPGQHVARKKKKKNRRGLVEIPWPSDPSAKLLFKPAMLSPAPVHHDSPKNNHASIACEAPRSGPLHVSPKKDSFYHRGAVSQRSQSRPKVLNLEARPRNHA